MVLGQLLPQLGPGVEGGPALTPKTTDARAQLLADAESRAIDDISPPNFGVFQREHSLVMGPLSGSLAHSDEGAGGKHARIGGICDRIAVSGTPQTDINTD